MNVSKVIYVRCDPKKNKGAVQNAIGVVSAKYQPGHKPQWVGTRYNKKRPTSKKFRTEAAAERWVRKGGGKKRNSRGLLGWLLG